MASFLDTWAEQRNKLRKHDLHVLFHSVPDRLFGEGLELGAGDGFQSRILIRHCKKLVCTEYNREQLDVLRAKKIPGLSYRIADAEALPFKDASFDFVFSSNLLEHIKDMRQCLSELYRVLKDDGIMIHVMPNRLWKLFNFFLYYPFVLSAMLSKEKRAVAFRKLRQDARRSNIKSRDRSLLSKLFPSVHGEDPGHITEFLHFGKQHWKKVFAQHGFTVRAVLPLSLSSSYRFGLDSLRNVGYRVGMCTSYAYVVTKKGKGKAASLGYFLDKRKGRVL